jgi:hypothetical protein
MKPRLICLPAVWLTTICLGTIWIGVPSVADAQSERKATTEPKATAVLNPFDIKTTPSYKRIKASIDAVRAVDTHDHLRPFVTRQSRRAATEHGTVR